MERFPISPSPKAYQIMPNYPKKSKAQFPSLSATWKWFDYIFSIGKPIFTPTTPVLTRFFYLEVQEYFNLTHEHMFYIISPGLAEVAQLQQQRADIEAASASTNSHLCSSLIALLTIC
jgi:hypothetical protein